jgi:O-antigen/teichoic acid export membrane protein
MLIPKMGYYGPAWAALACYAFMIATCYWTGQKHYPIDYPIGRMTAYIMAALGAYGISLLYAEQLESSLILKLGANTIVLLLFVLFITYLERTTLLQQLARFRKPPRREKHPQ